MLADDWGCGESFDGAFGSTKTLNELVDGLSSRKPEVASGAFSFESGSTDVENVPVQVVPVIMKSRPNSAPKILKKKSTINKINKEPNLKRVTFEVEQLLTREGSAASKKEVRDRLLVSLGGLPAPQEHVNYKVLKRQREEAKQAAKAEESLNGFSHRVVKKKKK